MPSFKTTRRVPYSASEMFALVADVERYPEFVPLCESLVVTSRTVAAPAGSGAARPPAGSAARAVAAPARAPLQQPSPHATATAACHASR